jgi:hypothetical protein
MSEYYIKQPNTDNARGPLTLEQMISMAETGMVTQDTLLYDEISEKWRPVSSFTELLPVLFPEKKALRLNRKEPGPTEQQVATAIAEGRTKPKVSAESILAAASGDTRKTRHVGEARRSKEKAIATMVPGIGGLLLISGIALLFPVQTRLFTGGEDGGILLEALFHPMPLLGLCLLGLSVSTFLGVTSLFSMVRAIASITMGMSAYFFWAWGNPYLMVASTCLGLGIFTATFSLRYGWLLISLLTGLVGSAAIAYASILGYLTY